MGGGGDRSGPWDAELERGATLGRYVVLNLLGKGGMGEVYAAYDPELDRKVAIKLLRSETHAGMDGAEARARLLREAQAIAKLSDPNVLVVYDVGTFGERVFLAMELIDGSTLGFWREAHRRSWREIVACFMAAGRGLAAAHRAGLVHRDFKPDNVMVSRDGQVRVMDFGLARLIGGDGGEAAGDPGVGGSAAAGASDGGVSDAKPRSGDSVRLTPKQLAAGGGKWTEDDLATRNLSPQPSPPAGSPVVTGGPSPRASGVIPALTQEGAMIGTPAYMAPEQFKGVTADERSDQFSFCIALYEGLYGQRPFAGKNLAALTANVLEGRVRDAPAKTKVPAWLRRVVLRGLRVESAERYPSMEQLLAALAHDPARTRNRSIAAFGAVVALAAVGVSARQLSQRGRLMCVGGDAKLAGVWSLPAEGAAPTATRKEAIRRAFLATNKRYAADAFAAVSAALDRYTGTWGAMYKDACEATHLRGEQSAEVLDLRMSCLGDRLTEAKALTNVLTEANGEVVSKAAQAVQSLRPVEQCADVAALRAVVRPPDDPAVRKAVADVRDELANVKALTSAGGYKRALSKISEIVANARRTQYQPVIAEALVQNGSIHEVTLDAVNAERAYEEGVWLAEASRHDQIAAEAAAQLVIVVGHFQARHSEGERWGRLAKAVLQRLGPGHELLAGWRANNLAAIYFDEGKLEESLASSLEALALKKKVVGEDHFDVAVTLGNAAMVLFRLGRIDEAIEQNQRALAILRGALGADHPRLADFWVNEAEYLNARGRFAEANTSAQRALSLWERELGPEHPFLAAPLTALGWSWILRGESERAIPFLERALSLQNGKDAEPAQLAETRFALARALAEQHRRDGRALRLAVEARGDYRRAGGMEKRLAELETWLGAGGAGSSQVSMR